MPVSIHAPVWVRPAPRIPAGCNCRFQFTHPCGCDLHGYSGTTRRPLFQFTHPCGCDQSSTGATPPEMSFNSRTRVGATRYQRRQGPSCRFQFTHPCGCDCMVAMGRFTGASFNSRTRVGATSKYTGACHEYAVSIHAPVWVRRNRAGIGNGLHKFQFTHPCGCDGFRGCKIVKDSCFNSRTRVGATLIVSTSPVGVTVSIHAPVWVRLGQSGNRVSGFRFQFTHPCGCD